ncbi:calcineurin-like phosphoesterase [Thraustotheca clavata]|uniref:Calcineurin-like phosphoesterase n=1 Tax=Thraustotheca clavata TaxID=74557 RepID=A0A1V9Y687_9STRA|nr:calcineurin-like phosphoesterase [Thraustotheca clavata]
MTRADGTPGKYEDSVTEIPIMDFRESEEPEPRRRFNPRMIMAIAGVCVLAIAGVAVAVVMTGSKGSSSSTNSSKSNPSSGSNTNTNGNSAGSSTGSGTGNSSTNSNVTMSDPETDTVLATMLAIGDWGSTTGKKSDGSKPGSCCILYTTADSNFGKVDTTQSRYKVDFYAQSNVATLMAQSASQLKPSPSRILSHGDNIYWDGVGKDDAAYRFATTFEAMYSASSLQGITWLNVAGNHDLGGASYICGDDNDNFRKCTSTEEMLSYLDSKFNLQQTYKSPNQDRWKLTDHYYIEHVSKNGVTIDILNLDTNHADVHGAPETCCQCYGYSSNTGQPAGFDPCKTVARGDKFCCGGDSDMYDKCVAKLEDWASQSYDGAVKDLAASKADFKIINTHYSPHYHMNPTRMQKWHDLTKKYKVHAWINGHTHGFNHDISPWNTHFFVNGAGGGISSQSAMTATSAYGVTTKWAAAGQPYGYLELSFSKQWMKVQFATFDSKWSFGGFDQSATVTGGVARGHCWFIHTSLSTTGVECKSSTDGALGAP